MKLPVPTSFCLANLSECYYVFVVEVGSFGKTSEQRSYMHTIVDGDCGGNFLG